MSEIARNRVFRAILTIGSVLSREYRRRMKRKVELGKIPRGHPNRAGFIFAVHSICPSINTNQRLRHLWGTGDEK
jgi:hypothetical protein